MSQQGFAVCWKCGSSRSLGSRGPCIGCGAKPLPVSVLSSAPQEPQWLPIEIAPRNGVWFIGYGNQGGIPSMAIVRDEDGVWKHGDVEYGSEYFSHWMPLPAPPKENE